nr:immunoglobulin light chain junction region [Macaca mulatta]
CLQRNFYPFTF